jgi:hypothetical protein
MRAVPVGRCARRASRLFGDADLLVDSDIWIARGELDDSTGDLRRLIGPSTTTLADAVGVALARA